MVLSGWKAIANYLKGGTRTVQRWEKEAGLPVLRPRPGPRRTRHRLFRAAGSLVEILQWAPPRHP